MIVGKVCTRHPELNGKRYVSYQCPACVKARQSAWRLANPEKHRESDRKQKRRAWAANPEKHRQKNRDWRAANPQAVRESQQRADRKRYLANPAKFVAKTAAYRARKRNLRPALSAIERAQYQEFFDLARARTAQTGTAWEVDHDVPLALGGADHPSNLILLPRQPNRAKGARFKNTFEFLLS